MKFKLVSFFLILAAASLACGFSIDIPKAATPGPDVTDQITVAVPGSGETRLVLNFGAGKIDVSAGAKGLVNGTATYNIPDLKPVITAEGDLVHIAQGNFKFKTLGALKEVHNEWDLKLGAARPLT